MGKNLLKPITFWLFTFIVVFQSLPTNAFCRTIYVDQNASGGAGTSWADAYNNLQAAIGASVENSGDEIWVAAGVYKPDDGSGNRADTFSIKSGTALYGGFAGYETSRDQRNWRVNETVLSGDLNGDDSVTFNPDTGAVSYRNYDENSFHVILISSGSSLSPVVLDGFVISGGNADENPDDENPNNYGGGLRIDGVNTEPIISNCLFRANRGKFGGGIASIWAKPKVLQCLFSGNRGDSQGGAIYYYSVADTYIANSVFSKNRTGGRGGGIYIYADSGYGGGDLKLINSIVWDNLASVAGNQIGIENLSLNGFGLYILRSDVQGGIGAIYNSDAGVIWTDSLSENPEFVDSDGPDNIPGTPDDNLHLQQSSPCIDAGSNTLTNDQYGDPIPLSVDFDLHSRFFDDPAVADDGFGTPPIIDMGAYERTNIIHVDQDAVGNNDGTNWRDAFVYLQDGLSAAGSGNEIWVANGTYYPDDGAGYDPDDSEASFAMRSGVALYGGFAGWESRREQRDPVNNQSKLSGLIRQLKPPVYSYHVVTATNTNQTAILDGFVIQSGNGRLFDPQDPWNKGGGLYIDGGRPTIANCSFRSNDADFGGAIYLFNAADPKVINCSFFDNFADEGGGVYADFRTAPGLINCAFLDNTAIEGGGLYAAIESQPTITNSTFYGNHADQYGGALYCADYALCSIFNSILWGNTAGKGPQIALEAATLVGDYSAIQGGAEDITTGAGSVLDLQHFIAPLLNPFHDSSGRLAAGSACIDAGDNRAVPSDSHDLDNDGNTAERLPVDLDGLSRFIDDPFAIDSGWGDPPNYPHIVDMGAYERQRPPAVTLHVDATAGGANNGSSWADAYVTLQDALQTAQDGDVIWVAAGTYKPTQGGLPPADPRDATFQLKNGVALYGGFPQGGGTWPPSPAANETILSGDINGDDDSDFHNYDENVRHVVTGSGTGASAVLDGFTITGGSASNVPYPADSGGGMYNYLGSPTVRNCIFRYNLAGSRGGAMFNQEYNSTVSDCIFAHNRARNGGAMYNSYSSSPTVTNCTFYFNQALEYGGAAQDVFNSHPTFSNCTFSVNTAGNSGGAIGSYAGGPTLVRTILWQNDAGAGRQISLWGGSSVTVICSDVEGGQGGILTTGGEIINWGSGNIDADPRFCQPVNDDYTIAENSPCSPAVSTCGLIGAWPVGCSDTYRHDSDFDGDVDGLDLRIYVDENSYDDLGDFAREFGNNDQP